MKLSIFKGLGSEDLDQFWFVVKAVWMAQNITYDHIKKVQLVTTLQYHVLSWYIKYYTNNTLASLADTHIDLNKEFGRPKSKTQSVVGFKEIIMRVDETP